MDAFEATAPSASPAVSEIADLLAERFISATRAALGEMADIEVAARVVGKKEFDHAAGDVTAVIGLPSAAQGALVLFFPQATAAALARRILAGVAERVDDSLVRDCVGEIANVVAGQAKALLAGTPFHYSFSPPEVFSGGGSVPLPKLGTDCLFVTFTCVLGEFALEVCRKL
jgi:chemotaxis protein CheX